MSRMWGVGGAAEGAAARLVGARELAHDLSVEPFGDQLVDAHEVDGRVVARRPRVVVRRPRPAAAEAAAAAAAIPSASSAAAIATAASSIASAAAAAGSVGAHRPRALDVVDAHAHRVQLLLDPVGRVEVAAAPVLLALVEHRRDLLLVDVAAAVGAPVHPPVPTAAAAAAAAAVPSAGGPSRRRHLFVRWRPLHARAAAALA